MQVQDAMLGRLEMRLRELDVPLSITLWNGRQLAPKATPEVSVTVRSPAVLAALVHPTLGKLARHYVEQHLDIEGEARQIIRVGEALSGAPLQSRGGTSLLRKWIGHTRLFDSKAVPVSLRCRRRFLRTVARSAARLFMRVFSARRRHARSRAGAEARSHLP